MAKLILSIDKQVLREIPLDKERITIGRRPQNDIQIDNLAVSGNHAMIVTILNDHFLEDLDSTNGTFVNGRQIHKHFLQDNDVIELGKYRLKYVKENTSPGWQDFEKTMVLRPGETQKFMKAFSTAQPPAQAQQADANVAPAEQPAPMRASEGAPASAAAMARAAAPDAARESAATPGAGGRPEEAPLGAIRILTGGNAGRLLDLVKPATTLGKARVQVAVILRRPEGYFIRHAEGAARPQVNGAPIGFEARPLKDRDIIELAGVKMEFFLKH